MKDTVLTENEKKLISQIVTDERTGKYLLKKKQQVWYTKNNEILLEREKLGESLPVQELLQIAYKDNKENNK